LRRAVGNGGGYGNGSCRCGVQRVSGKCRAGGSGVCNVPDNGFIGGIGWLYRAGKGKGGSRSGAFQNTGNAGNGDKGVVRRDDYRFIITVSWLFAGAYNEGKNTENGKNQG
jgi:hypothetical protein